MTKKLVLSVLAMLFTVSAWATSLVCSLDKMSLMWTGKIKVDTSTAQMLYQHKCIQNHYFWLTQEQMDR